MAIQNLRSAVFNVEASVNYAGRKCNIHGAQNAQGRHTTWPTAQKINIVNRLLTKGRH